MIVSFKSQADFDYLPPLLLNHVSLERVYSFKYLGLQFSPSMSWSNHISQVIKKAKRLLGLIYRHFYKSSSKILLSLYVTLVRLILEYTSVIWVPSSPSVSSSLEAVHHFALKLASKSWSSSYSSLLSSFNISSLSQCRAKSTSLNLNKTIPSVLFPCPVNPLILTIAFVPTLHMIFKSLSQPPSSTLSSRPLFTSGTLSPSLQSLPLLFHFSNSLLTKLPLVNYALYL